MCNQLEIHNVVHQTINSLSSFNLKNQDQLLLLTIKFSVSRSVDNNEVGEVIGREQLLLTHQNNSLHVSNVQDNKFITYIFKIIDF